MGTRGCAPKIHLFLSASRNTRPKRYSSEKWFSYQMSFSWESSFLRLKKHINVLKALKRPEENIISDYPNGSQIIWPQRTLFEKYS